MDNNGVSLKTKKKIKSKNFLYTTKGKLLISIIVVTILAVVGLGVGLGISSNKDNPIDKYPYLTKANETQIWEALNKLSEDAKPDLISFIIANSNAIESELTNKNLDELKEQFIQTYNDVIGESPNCSHNIEKLDLFYKLISP